jgi:hypothetical protein
LDNHREYIENVIKSIAKAKYKDMTKNKKDKRNRLGGGAEPATTKIKKLSKISYHTTI